MVFACIPLETAEDENILHIVVQGIVMVEIIMC